jgi:hypothetical protein
VSVGLLPLVTAALTVGIVGGMLGFVVRSMNRRIDDTFGGLDARLGTMETRLGSVEASVRDLTVGVHDVGKRLAVLESAGRGAA